MDLSNKSNFKNKGLGSKETKNKILQYLYSSVNINVKHEDIMTEKDLDLIRDTEYVICPRFSGTRSWILFFKSGDNYFAVNFPKHNQEKKNDLQIHPIEMGVVKEVYTGTIMEGIFFKIEQERYLVIDEIYTLGGKNQLIKSKEDRLTYAAEYLNKNSQKNPNFHISVSQFYSTSKKQISNCFDKIKTDSKIQGLTFYPQMYGSKIFYYTIVETDLIDDVVKLSKFRMKKTDKPDVYYLYTMNGNKNIKFDLAHIPDMQTSKRCKQWFKDNKVSELTVKCQMDLEKTKWVPILLVEEDLVIDDMSDDNKEEAEA
jgi:hypothetical protein